MKKTIILFERTERPDRTGTKMGSVDGGGH